MDSTDLAAFIGNINSAIVNDWAVFTGRAPISPATSTSAATYALQQQQQQQSSLLLLVVVVIVGAVLMHELK